MSYANSSNQTKKQSKKPKDRDAKYKAFLSKKRRYSNRQSRKYLKAYKDARNAHSVFRDWKLIYANFFNGYAVQADKGPLIKDDVIRLIQTVVTSYLTNTKVFTCRVDLYFPSEWETEKRLEIDYYSRFIKSLGEQMIVRENQLEGTERSDGKSNERNLFVRHFRTMEFGDGTKRKTNLGESKQGDDRVKGVHIHAVLMFNGHEFTSLGDLKDLSQDGVGRKIMAAWASALFGYSRKHPESIEPKDWRYTIPNWENIAEIQKQGLVNFAREWAPSKDKSQEKRECKTRFQIGSIIFAASYLCKAEQKIKFTKENGFFKIASGSRLPQKGVKKSKGLHRCQIDLPLYQRGDLNSFWDLGAWKPNQAYGAYISSDLKQIVEYLTDFREMHKSFIAIEGFIEIPDKYIEVKGKSFSDVVMGFFSKEVVRKVERAGMYPERLMGGLYKEVIRRDRKRYLHWIILMDSKLSNAMTSSPNYRIESHLFDIAKRVIDGWGGNDQPVVELCQVVEYTHEAFPGGNFYKMLDLCSRLALSENAPVDLVMSFVKKLLLR